MLQFLWRTPCDISPKLIKAALEIRAALQWRIQGGVQGAGAPLSLGDTLRSLYIQVVSLYC